MAARSLKLDGPLLTLVGARALRVAGDDALARMVANGSQRAFAAIYQRHHQALYRYCISILHDREDALDALHSTMERALDALIDEEREIAVKPWLFRIAHNEAISIARRRRPDRPTPGEAEREAELAEVTGQLERRESLTRLVEDLGQLPERQRGALLMRELSGLSYTEISAALETTEPAAKQAVYEARQALHEINEGREMRCDEVRAIISTEDARRLRARRVRAHLDECDECHDFLRAISDRKNQLGLLAPPIAAGVASQILAALFGGGGGSGGGGLLAGLGTAGAAAGIPAAIQATAATVAVVAVGGAAVVVNSGGSDPVAPAVNESRVAEQGGTPAGPGLAGGEALEGTRAERGGARDGDGTRGSGRRGRRGDHVAGLPATPAAPDIGSIGSDDGLGGGGGEAEGPSFATPPGGGTPARKPDSPPGLDKKPGGTPPGIEVAPNGVPPGLGNKPNVLPPDLRDLLPRGKGRRGASRGLGDILGRGPVRAIINSLF